MHDIDSGTDLGVDADLDIDIDEAVVTAGGGAVRPVQLPPIDSVTPDEVVTKLSGAKLESVTVPLMYKKQALILVLGHVSQVGQRAVTKGEDVRDVRTATLAVEDGLLINDEVMAALPPNPTVTDLWQFASAAALREADRRAGNMPGAIGDYLPEHSRG